MAGFSSKQTISQQQIGFAHGNKELKNKIKDLIYFHLMMWASFFTSDNLLL